MTDDYFYPKTIKKCHERIDDILHTNKTQAETIGELKSKLRIVDAELQNAMTQWQSEASKRGLAESKLISLRNLLTLLGDQE